MVRRKHRRLDAGFCIVFLALALPAQVPDTSAPDQTLRVTTRLVEVSVVAESKNGEPVADLTREDFIVLDGGRREQITFFSLEKPQPREPAPRPLPPDIFANRLEPSDAPPASATVVLFDGLNTRLTDQAYARQQIVSFLEQLQPQDRVALYVMGRGPRVLQDFTSDSASLLKALADYRSDHSPSLDSPLYDPAVTGSAHLDAWLGELTFNLYDYFERDRAFRTIRSLVAIANHLERVPGRKNLIWVSGSFPVWIGDGSVPKPMRRGKRSVVPEIDQAARALNRANLAIYPVDARGLMAPQEYRADRAGLSPDSRLADQAMFTIMRTLAERTGGRAFYSNNDLRAALRRAADDARMTYVLGYYPSHDRWNGKFREIKVQVGRPGVELHYRRGYFAQSEEPADSWYREEVLEAAMWSPVEATGVGLAVRVTPSGGRLDLGLQIDARDITFRPKSGAWECGLDIWLVQLDQKEDHLKTDARTNNLRLDQATYDRVMQAKGLLLMERLKPASEALLLRVLVRDIASGALGSVTIPIRSVPAETSK